MDLQMSLKGNLAKASLVGVTGAVLSCVVLGGFQAVPVAGMFLPKALVHGVALAGSSVAASYIVPRLTPYVSVNSPQLSRFDALVLEPLVLGAVFLGVESVVSPAAEVQGPGGTFRELISGATASVVASYVSQGMGWAPSVI